MRMRKIGVDHNIEGDDTRDAPPSSDAPQGLGSRSGAGDSQHVSSHVALDIIHFFKTVGDPGTAGGVPLGILHAQVCKPCM